MFKKKYLVFFLPFLFLAIFYFFRVPVGQTPDEPAHISYLEHIARYGSIPTYDYSEVTHHPPLYYLLMAPWYRVFKNIYLLRFFSIIFSFLNLLIIWKLIEILFPASGKKKDLALGTAVFCSLVPMYNFMSVAVSNDPLTGLLGSIMIYFSLLALSKSFNNKEYIFWALFFFMAIFTKIILWPAVFISGITVFFSQKARRISVLAVFGLSFSVLCLWFYRNVSLYGNWDILGWKKLMQVEYILVESRMIERDPRGWLVILFHSFWGIFSWFSIYLPLMIYSILRKLTVFLFIPFLIFLADFFKNSPRQKKYSLLLFFSFFVLAFAALVKDNMNFFHPQGRYLFSVISVIGLFYTIGIFQISEIISKVIFKKYQNIVFYFLLFVPLLALNVLSAVTINNYFIK